MKISGKIDFKLEKKKTSDFLEIVGISCFLEDKYKYVLKNLKNTGVGIENLKLQKSLSNSNFCDIRK